MKRIILAFLIVLIGSVQLKSQELTATDILKKSDEVVNAPKDQDLRMKLILIDKNGNEQVREAIMLQKGDDKRMVKFLSPAGQKGIAFLDLPDDQMYLYLPAFKKVRRIAGHIKNQKFAGTDLTYEDIATLNYSNDYNPKIVKKTEEYFILELTPKEGIKKDYSKLKMWVRTDNFYPEKIEYYKGSNLLKISERKKIEKVGPYWISKELEIHDLKENHRTKSVLEDVKFDTGLNDNLFTQRYLKRR